MRPSTRGGLRFVLSCVSQPPGHFGDGKHREPMGMISSWADGVVGWWQRAWVLGEVWMEEEDCDWVLLPGCAWGVPGCVPEESDASVFECRGGICKWHAGRQK